MYVCVYIYVCVYVCMYVYMCVYVCVYVCVCMYICMCVCICMFVCMYMVCMYYVYVYVYMHVCVYVCMCVCRLILAIHRNKLQPHHLAITVNTSPQQTYLYEMQASDISVHHIGAAHSSDLLDRDAVPLGELLPKFRRSMAPSSSTTSGSFSSGPLTAGDQRSTISPSAGHQTLQNRASRPTRCPSPNSRLARRNDKMNMSQIICFL